MSGSNLPKSSTVKRLITAVAGTGCFLLAACIFAIFTGPVPIDFLRAWSDPASADAHILFQVRLPWILLAAFAGAGLSVVGSGFQAILRNPLADPFILGMSGGASFGAVLFITLDLHQFLGSGMLPVAGFFGALLATLLVWRLARRQGQSGNHTMLLAGVVVNAMFGALIMFLISLARPQAVHQTAIWLMGVLDVFQVPRSLQWIAASATLASVLYFVAMARHLNTLSLGDAQASTLGTDPARIRFRLFLAGAIIVGGTTAVAGPIGFVGLIVPHALRMIFGSDHRVLVPACALGGAGFLVLAGSIARMAFPITQTAVPVGVLTASLGGPFFLWLLSRRGTR